MHKEGFEMAINGISNPSLAGLKKSVNTLNTTTTVDAKNQAAAQETQNKKANVPNPDAILGKDDFMKLLLVELQYQDPTDPMDTQKVLTQTSQLATLESSNNTNEHLEKLSKVISGSQGYAMLSAIGKIASLGDDGLIINDKNKEARFQIYLPSDAKKGEIQIKNSEGELVSKIDFKNKNKGIISFNWDGKTAQGRPVPEGIYDATAVYTNTQGARVTAKMGIYPVSGIQFKKGEVYVKLGDEYMAMSAIKEIKEPALVANEKLKPVVKEEKPAIVGQLDLSKSAEKPK